MMTFLSPFWMSEKIPQPASILFINVILILIGMLVSMPVGAQEISNTESEPKIIMLDAQGITPYDVELYNSIRAQLSVSPVSLRRIDLSNAIDFTAKPLTNASQATRENDAAMVFWIEDKKECRLFFYIPDETGGRINSRTLKLDLNNSWSRFQVIAIAAASMVEGLLVSYRLHPELSEKETVPTAPEPIVGAPVVGVKEKRIERKKFEVSTIYSGRLWGSQLWANGVGPGVGIRLNKHVVTSMSFIIGFPMVEKNSEYRLSIFSYIIGVSGALRWLFGPIDFRVGIESSIDLRAFSATSHMENLTTVDDGIKAIAVLSPMLSVLWIGRKRMGVISRLGADFSLNDTVYSISRVDGDTAEITPYRIKLSIQLGFVILI